MFCGYCFLFVARVEWYVAGGVCCLLPTAFYLFGVSVLGFVCCVFELLCSVFRVLRAVC